MLKGRIIKNISNLYTVLCGEVTYDCTPRGKFRLQKKTPLVGDICVIDEENKYILELEPRKNELKRPVVCNVDVTLIVTAAKKPDFSSLLLDKELSLSLLSLIEPVIYFSKLDLLNEEERRKLSQIMNTYKEAGFPVFDSEHVLELTQFLQKKVVVLTGQTGAGKSGLVNLTNREGILTNRSFYLIDDDQFRKFYPRYDEIMAECPEFSTILTAMGSGPITPKIMKYASDNGLNFIFDGTMKNTRIFETAQQWKDYDVTYRVMATSRMESLLSIFERNAFLRRNGFGRPIGVKEHDATYDGLENTLSTVESAGEVVEVYVRGRSISCMPELIYSSKQKGFYKSSVEALRDGRARDKKFCINNDVQGRITNLETSDIGLNSVECKSLCELKEALEEEMAAER